MAGTLLRPPRMSTAASWCAHRRRLLRRDATAARRHRHAAERARGAKRKRERAKAKHFLRAPSSSGFAAAIFARLRSSRCKTQLSISHDLSSAVRVFFPRVGVRGNTPVRSEQTPSRKPAGHSLPLDEFKMLGCVAGWECIRGWSGWLVDCWGRGGTNLFIKSAHVPPPPSDLRRLHYTSHELYRLSPL